MPGNSIVRILLILAVAGGMGLLVTLSRQEKPRLISVKPPGNRVAMPAFAWPAVSGGNWSLAEQKGKIVLVNFWAVWCGPCRAETPDLVRVYDSWRSRGVSFVGIAMDSRPSEVVPPFAARYKMGWPNLVPTPDSALANAIQVLPTTFLLDRSGRVARTWAGRLHEAELTKNLEELLAEKTP